MRADQEKSAKKRDIVLELLAWSGFGLVFFGTWKEFSLAMAGIVLGVFLVATAVVAANKK